VEMIFEIAFYELRTAFTGYYVVVVVIVNVIIDHLVYTVFLKIMLVVNGIQVHTLIYHQMMYYRLLLILMTSRYRRFVGAIRVRGM
jgi:hypothetical protein